MAQEHSSRRLHAKVKISFLTKHESWPFWREMPERLRSMFTLDEDEDADFLVVYDGLLNPIRTTLPLERTLAILPEPPSVKRYHPRFLEQFGHILTVDRRIRHPNRHLGWSTMNWFYGVKFTQQGLVPSLHSVDEIRLDSHTHSKNRVASVVISDKAFTKEQRFRIKFVAELSSLLGADLDVFGRESNPIADKRDAITPYQFHIALENDCLPHYFSEKLLDSFLGGAFPIYRGAPNISRYFPPNSLSPIPESLTPREAAEFTANEIRRVDFESKADPIRQARNMTLSRYNVFEATFRMVQQLTDGSRRPRGVLRDVKPETRSLRGLSNTARLRLRRRIARMILP